MRKLTKRYIISSLENLNLSEPIRYERYYINDNLRIQLKNYEYYELSPIVLVENTQAGLAIYSKYPIHSIKKRIIS